MAELLQSFKFQITMTRSPSSGPAGIGSPARLGDGGFAECSGLDLEADIKEYLEGGRNNGVTRRVGRVKLQPLILKRGMFASSAAGYADTQLWQWLTAMVAGQLPIPRYDGIVQVGDPARPLARWIFTRGLPLKVAGPSLNARTGEIAIEELHIAHEGLSLAPPG